MKESIHLLVVDDDREIRQLLSRFLSEHGFRVSAARDEREMQKALADSQIDLIILDIMLPGRDGLTLCREVRARSNIPIVMLTAMGDDLDRIIGLEMGADDYIAKPFNPRELLARVKAVLRRASPTQGQVTPGDRKTLRFGGWSLDLARRRLLSPHGVEVDLTSGEFDLLAALVQRPQRVLRRDQLIDLARGRAAAPFDRSVDVQVSRIRRKLRDDPKRPEMIKTVRGGGYVFTATVEGL